MKQIKLEVGKTYRNRKGEEVKIVEKQETVGRHAYRGSDDEWYTERGRFDISVAESECDLIEEVPSETIRHTFTIPDDKELTLARYTLAIPDGMKEVIVSQVGSRIVVEMVPEAKGPKPGDVCLNDMGSVYIFKEAVNKHTHRHYAWFGRDGRVAFSESAISGRPATPEEAQPLFEALKKAGKRWNPEAMRVEEIPEIDRILEWVEENIKDGYYNQEDVAEAIEGYLKQKEDKK